MYVSIAVVLVVVAGAFFVFRSCGNPGINPNDPIRPGVTKAFLDESSGPQPFLMIGLTLPKEDKERFKITVNGLPQGMKVNERRLPFSIVTYDSYMTVDPKGFEGVFDYSVEVTYKDLKKDFTGSFVVGKIPKNIDTYYGGAGKNAIVDSEELKSVNFSNSYYAGAKLASNICALGETAIVGNLKGELRCVDYFAKELWNAKVFEDPIIAVQTAGNTVIAMTSLGEMAAFDAGDLKAGKAEPIGKLNTKAAVSSPPTVISEKLIICGFKDGTVKAISLPDLDVLWSNNAFGSIVGQIPAWVVRDKDGKDHGFVYPASESKSLFMFDLDGGTYLRNRFSETLAHGATMIGNNLLIGNTGNYSRYMNTLFDVFMEINLEDKNAFQPLLSGDKAAFISKDKIFVRNTKDNFSDVWSAVIPEKISTQPFLIGSRLFVPTSPGKAKIFNVNDGVEKEPIDFGSKLSGLPVKIGKERFALPTIDGTIYFFGENAVKKPNPNDLPSNKEEVVIHNGYLSNLDHNAYLDAKLPKSLNKKWELDGNFAAPITTTKRIYVYSISDKYFACHDIATGSQIWKASFEAPNYKFTANIHGSINTPMWLTSKGLYVSTKVGLKLLNAANGEVLAQTSINGIPQADDNIVVATDDKALYCFENNLNLKWKKEGKFFPANVIIDKDAVFAADSGKETTGLYFLDKQKGSVLWRNPDKSDLSTTFFIKMFNSPKHIYAITRMGMWYMTKSDKKISGISQGSGLARDAFFNKTAGFPMVVDRMGFISIFDMNTGKLRFSPEVMQSKTPPDLISTGMCLASGSKVVSFGTAPPVRPTPSTPPKKGEKPPPVPDTVVFKLYIRDFSKFNSEISVDLPEVTKNFFGISLGDGLVIAFRPEKENAKLIVYGE